MAGITRPTGSVMTKVVEGSLKEFCQKFGVSGQLILEPIRSGRNSQVHKISNSHGDWILKNYLPKTSDKRDRMGTEFGFLSYLKKIGSFDVATPIGMDRDLNCALYSYISGVRPVTITNVQISQAAHFIKSINLSQNKPEALGLSMAADACTSWNAHLDLVELRINSLLAGQPQNTEDVEVQQFVRDHLQPFWHHIKTSFNRTNSTISLELSLPMESWIISPSDFGFHNVLEAKEKLFFLDFEYAGWDDPAKLICDFICQPEVPITHEQVEQFMSELLPQFAEPEKIRQRVELLLPVHRLKWCCILLNEFKMANLNRRLHAGVELDGLLQTQLSKSKIYFKTHLSINNKGNKWLM
jgi:hypothetical protein